MRDRSPRGDGGRLFAYLRAQWATYSLGVAALVLTNVSTAGIPYLTKRIFDALADPDPGDLSRRVGTLALGILGLAACLGGFRVLSRVFIFNGGREVEVHVRNDLYAHLQTLSPTFFGRSPVGDLVSRLTNDITALRLLGGPGLLNLANTVIAYVAAVTPMFLISPSLTGWALAPLVFVFAATRLVSRHLYTASYAAQEELAALSSTANETITGIAVLHAYAREKERQARFVLHSDRYRVASLRLVLLRSVLIPIFAGMGGLGTLTILYFGGGAVVDGTMTLGDFVAFIGYLGMLMWPTVALGWLMSLWQRGRAAADRLGEIFDTPSELEREAERPPPEVLAGSLELRGLSFGWTDAEGVRTPVLHDLNLSVSAGEQVLIVGPSGAGKSTLVSLFPRLSEVPPGSVFVGGRDVRSYPTAWLRRRIAFVPQEPFLFSMSIEENIGFGLDDPDPGTVRRAAALAALTGEIERLPRAWQTLVGERGVTLSGGQRQRMTIARAAVLQPAVWVFDDCLSSVDAETEQRILRGLRAATGGATALFVTHRLLGFEGVDRILVVREGRLAEQGTHEELLRAGGWYAALYRRQRLDRQLAGATVPDEVA